MALLIVVTSSKQTQQNMENARRNTPDIFLGKPARNVYLMKSNGLALWYAWKEKDRHPLFVDVYLADEVHQWQIPETIRRSTEWKAENRQSSYPVLTKTLKRQGMVSREELEKIALDFSIR